MPKAATPRSSPDPQPLRLPGLAGRVGFLGELDSASIPGLIAASDVLIDTPWHEPLGRSPLEAMATGVPVVASDVGAASYQLADGVTGFLVRPRDPIGLAMRLEQLHANPDLSSSMGQAGAERARAYFAWEVVAQHLLKTVAAARLMGADCIISGIRPQIAQTIVHLGVNLEDVVTKATLADAFLVALERTGTSVVKRAHA